MTRIDDLLKTLDPATTDAEPNSPRAQADLRRILATEPTPVRRRKRPARRIAVATGAIAAAVTAVLVLTSALGGDRAFATWTATPTGLSASERADAADSCRKHQRSGSPQYRDQLSKATTAIAERRGVWTLVVLADQNGFGALCITDDSRHLFRSYFGSIGTTPPSDRPTARGLTPISLGTGSIAGNNLSVATGLAGADVSTVTYTSPTRGKITATVNDSQFALWLPGNDLTSANQAGVPLQVTYRDGTTATITLRL
jgi:hypothetical protein